MKRTFAVNQDLGSGWRLLSVAKPLEGSRISVVVISKDGKTYTSRFDIGRKFLLDPPTLTVTQLHIIGTLIDQLLK